MISPDDYHILGYRPISSRTYFFVKLTNVLIYILGLATLMGFLPALMYAFTLGFNPAAPASRRSVRYMAA